jgi:hypothetical protein
MMQNHTNAENGFNHMGKQVFNLGERIKAILTPLEMVCRYREQRNDDMAQFTVTPRNKAALAFSIAAAPGGINLNSAVMAIHELPLTEAAIAVALVEAIVAGRVSQVRRIRANGQARVTKVYFIDESGKLIFKQRKSSGWLPLTPRAVRTERVRFADYREGISA